MSKELTVVITTFNRKDVVCESIDSVLKYLKESKIIIVDDCSGDYTENLIYEKYKKEIELEKIKFYKNKINVGVTGSKNYGFKKAKTKLVGFLDSDDKLLINSGNIINNEISMHPNLLLYFFKCIDQNGKIVGDKIKKSIKINLKDYVRQSSRGEAFTVINKSLFTDIPYYSFLRGYEGLGCSKILEKGNALLSSKVVREYNLDRSDRLSVGKQNKNRLKKLSIGHSIMINRYSYLMSKRQILLMKIKIYLYKMI